MVLLEIFQSKKSDPNIHQNAPNCTIFKNFSRRSMPPNLPSKAHGFAMRSMSLRGMQISKSQKHNSWPPPSQILGTPLYYVLIIAYKLVYRKCIET